MNDSITGKFQLDPATRIGPVGLKVANLSALRDFYQNVLGLETLVEGDGRVVLGAGGAPLLNLRLLPDAQPRPPRATGLYHLAILLPDRVELARLLRSLLQSRYPIGGASDHGVSEAVYLSDPEGNGLELYCDRPQAEWPRNGDELRMVTEALDVDDLFGELHGAPDGWSGMPAGTTVGHIHLQVSRIDESVAFYRDVLGLDLMQRYGPSAAFMSAGGYHHHVGMNTWAGVGAPRPPADAVGLDYYSIILPNREALEQAADHIRKTGAPLNEQNGNLQLEDPSGNRIALLIEE